MAFMCLCLFIFCLFIIALSISHEAHLFIASSCLTKLSILSLELMMMMMMMMVLHWINEPTLFDNVFYVTVAACLCYDFIWFYLADDVHLKFHLFFVIICLRVMRRTLCHWKWILSGNGCRWNNILNMHSIKCIIFLLFSHLIQLGFSWCSNFIIVFHMLG